MSHRSTRLVVFSGAVLVAASMPVASAGDEALFAGLKRIEYPGPFHRVIKSRDGLLPIVSSAATRLPGPRDTRVVVVNREGAEVFARTPGIDIPGAWLVNVMDAALRTPNALVVAAFVRTGEPEAEPLRPSERDAAVLLEYELATGKLVHRVTTTPIQCRDLAGDRNGTLYCFGIDLEKSNSGRQDYDLVYRFDATGTLLGSSLSRAELPTGTSGREPWLSLPAARAGFLPGGDTVRLWLPAIRQVFAFGPDGAVRERVTLPEWATPAGATEDYATGPDGQIIAMLPVPGDDTTSRRPWRQRLVRLASDAASWVELGGTPQDFPPGVHLVGAEGNELVLWSPEPRGFVWFPIPAEKPSTPTERSTR